MNMLVRWERGWSRSGDKDESWTSVSIARKELNLDGMLCTCLPVREKREILKYNIQGLIYAFGLLGPLLQPECIHCAYSNFTLRNDLHLSYLRSTGVVQGGFRPCSTSLSGALLLQLQLG